MTTRRATTADLPALRTVCALAYADNPLVRWVLPDDAVRLDACAAWLAPSLERYVCGGHVDVVTLDGDPTREDDGDGHGHGHGEVVALAAWRPVDSPPPGTTLPSPAGVLRALVGAARASQVLAGLAGTAALAPDRPGPYLNYLAVAPAHQGRGLGGRLLRHGLAARAGLPGTPWLATSDPRNVPFYERHGFARRGAHALGAEGPRLTVMHRT